MNTGPPWKQRIDRRRRPLVGIEAQAIFLKGTTVTSILEKGGSGFQGIRLLLCENPLPPIEEAIAAAQAEAAHGNY